MLAGQERSASAPAPLDLPDPYSPVSTPAVGGCRREMPRGAETASVRSPGGVSWHASWRFLGRFLGRFLATNSVQAVLVVMLRACRPGSRWGSVWGNGAGDHGGEADADGCPSRVIQWQSVAGCQPGCRRRSSSGGTRPAATDPSGPTLHPSTAACDRLGSCVRRHAGRVDLDGEFHKGLRSRRVVSGWIDADNLQPYPSTLSWQFLHQPRGSGHPTLKEEVT